MVGCPHRGCGCHIRAQGTCAALAGFTFNIECARMEESMREFVIELCTTRDWDGTRIVPVEQNDELLYIATGVKKSNIRLIPPIIPRHGMPEDSPLVQSSYKIERMMRVTDVQYFEMRTGLGFQTGWFEQNVWCCLPLTREVPSLQVLCARTVSPWRMAYGLENGRPPVISRKVNLYPRKQGRAILKQARPWVKVQPEIMETVRVDMVDVLDLLYYKLGTKNHIGKHRSHVDYESFLQMSLGTSEGINAGAPKQVVLPDESILKISPVAQKAEMFETNIKDVHNSILNGDFPPSYFKNSEKDELDLIEAQIRKVMSEDGWGAKLDKLRIFNIPSAVFIMFERLISQLRFAIERQRSIRIGGSHGHGGTDKLAVLLNIALHNCFEICIEAGDISGLDFSIPAEDLSIFYSSMLVYDIPEGPYYDIKKRIVDYVCRFIVNQLINLTASLWAIKTGGMPSGAWGTSHGDSWILLLWFCMFLLTQVKQAPPEKRDKLFEAALDLIVIVIYGDDHGWNRTMDPEIVQWFNGDAFSAWLKTYKDVDMRDQMCTSFASKTSNGYLTHRGFVFLKHFSVINPYRDLPNQPTFIAFRETPEFVVRAIHGRVPKSRTCFDVILSLLGHSYGTYASNRDAWEVMALMYQNCLDELGLSDEEVLSKILVDLSEDDVADFRRKGVDVADLIKGFPTWERLVRQNEISPIHDNVVRVTEDEALVSTAFDDKDWIA